MVAITLTAPDSATRFTITDDNMATAFRKAGQNQTEIGCRYGQHAWLYAKETPEEIAALINKALAEVSAARPAAP